MVRHPALPNVFHPIVIGITLLLSSVLTQSCARTKPYTQVEISTDIKVIEVIQNKSGSINSINASLGLKPASILIPQLDAYLSYKREGLFRLIGITPTGFTLFDFKTIDNQFTLSLSDGKETSGTLEEFIKGLKEIYGVDIPEDPEIVRDVLDFYGGEGYKDTGFFIEELKDYYILNQFRNSDNIAYPIRRWWIDKEDMIVVRKEIFSKLPDKRGERLFEILYGDFKIVDNIWIPFEIEIKGKEGNGLLKMKFNKVEYNK